MAIVEDGGGKEASSRKRSKVMYGTVDNGGRAVNLRIDRTVMNGIYSKNGTVYHIVNRYLYFILFFLLCDSTIKTICF